MSDFDDEARGRLVYLRQWLLFVPNDGEKWASALRALLVDRDRLAAEVETLRRERGYCRTQWEVLESARLMDRRGLNLDAALHAGEKQVAERIAAWRAANGIAPPAAEPAEGAAQPTPPLSPGLGS